MGRFITYAQNKEDVILDAYFKDVKKGTYVDVGANHPIEDSVTKHFYQKGWRGINVEPIKELYDLLAKDRPDDTNVQVGISDESGFLILREYSNHGLSTFSDEMRKQYENSTESKTISYKDVSVPVITLSDLFTKYPHTHINFMKIDVEGLEYKVLEGNDWDKNRPEMLCIEANHSIKGKDWRKFLESRDYTKVWNDGLNDYYLARESNKRKTNFSYAETMLLGDQVFPYHVADRLEQMQGEIRDYQVRLEVQKISYEQLLEEKKIVNKELLEQQRFHNAVKMVIRGADRVIMAQIERLHVIKVRRGIRPNQEVISYDTSSREKLLKSIHEADLRAYYSTRIRKAPRKLYLYHTVRGLYVIPRKLIVKLFRLTYSVFKGNKYA